MKKPLLQIALDTFDLPSALAPLQKAHSQIDVIEAGTILCLAEGMHAIRVLKSLYPQKPILADVRIAEAGSIIAKMCFEAGASWVSVVSAATPTTVEVVFKEAQKNNGDVQIELIDGFNKEHLKVWRDIGIRQIITHRSRDAEVHGELTWSQRDFDEISMLADMGFLVTVTGGVEIQDIPLFKGVPVYIFIAGRAIRNATDPLAAASEFQNMLTKVYNN